VEVSNNGIYAENQNWNEIDLTANHRHPVPPTEDVSAYGPRPSTVLEALAGERNNLNRGEAEEMEHFHAKGGRLASVPAALI